MLPPFLGTKGLYLGMTVLAFGLAVLHPALMKPSLALLERLLPGPMPTIDPSLRYSVVMGLLAGYIFIWGFVGTAFFSLLNAVYPLPFAWLPIATAIYAASWIVGFLAPFAPSGLGVREGVIILLLGQYLPVPAVTAVAILFRLWLILAEVLWAAMTTRW